MRSVQIGGETMLTKWKKRLLAFLLAGVICIPAGVWPAVTVHAEETYPEGIGGSTAYAGTGGHLYDDRSVEEWADLLKELEQRLKEALLADEYTVDLTGMDLTYNEFLQAVSRCLPYFGGGIYPFSYEEGKSMSFINPYSREETEQIVNMVDEKIADIARETEGKTDFAKALAVHDYLVRNSSYDYENYKNNTLPPESYMAGNLLIKGVGVCEAYANAFLYFMLRGEVECYAVSSAEMNHAWNIVKIDGDYYHVDCTWDAPTTPSTGAIENIERTHLLVSDEKMLNELKHYGWTLSDLACDNTRYDNAYWKDISSPIVSLEGGEYYIRFDKDTQTGGLIARKDDVETAVADLGRWWGWGSNNNYVLAAYSGLFYRNGYLYYNTYDKIMRISPESGQTEVVYEPDLSNGYVYGIKNVGDEIQYEIKQKYSDNGTLYTAPVSLAVPVSGLRLDRAEAVITQGETLQLNVSVEPADASAAITWSSSSLDTASVDGNGLVTAKAEGNAVITVQSGDVSASCNVTVEAPEYMLGDVTEDGNVDIADLRMVLRSVCGKIRLDEVQTREADVEPDGKVDIQDLRKLLRFVCKKLNTLE